MKTLEMWRDFIDASIQHQLSGKYLESLDYWTDALDYIGRLLEAR